MTMGVKGQSQSFGARAYLHIHIGGALPGVVVIQGYHSARRRGMLTPTPPVPLCEDGDKRREKVKIYHSNKKYVMIIDDQHSTRKSTS